MSDFVVFIENKSYLSFTYPYLQILTKMGADITIYTLEELELPDIDKSKILIFQNKKELNKSLASLSCDYFLTTTPGIGNFYFPKSKNFPKKNRPKYIYFFHSLVSPNENYVEKSFSGFDYILSPNKLITDQLKYLVKDKSTQIFTVGYQYLRKNDYVDNFKTGNILLAPSWGENNLFSDGNKEQLLNLVNKLKDSGLNVYLRPHPMEFERVKTLKDFFQVYFYLDYIVDHTNFDYLITDWSGISLEFFYSTSNPVGFVNTSKKQRRNLQSRESKLELIENQIIEKIGPKLNLENLDIKKLLKFSYSSSDYIDNLFQPEFNEIQVENLLRNL